MTAWVSMDRTREPLPHETDVLVIGGGIAGTALAHYLCASGAEVVLVERGELNREASGTNAGSFHLQLAIHQLSGQGTEADRDRLLADARSSVEAYALWRDLDRELGRSLDVHETGGWMVAETSEQLATLYAKHELEALAGIETEVVTGVELRSRAPYLREDLAGATFCPAEGHANPLLVAPVFAARAAEHGAVIRTHAPVVAIDVHGDTRARRFTVRTAAGQIDARRVVDCAGAWAGDVAAMVGIRLPVRREGLHVNVTEPRPPTLGPMVQHIGRRLTLKQTEAGTFIIGGGWPAPPAQPPRRYPTTWHSAAGNAAVAVTVLPWLADVRVVRTWSGVIVFTDDFSPVVGESRQVPGFHTCVASTGFTFGPLFARQLAEEMLAPGSVSPFPARYEVDRLMANSAPRSQHGGLA